MVVEVLYIIMLLSHNVITGGLFQLLSDRCSGNCGTYLSTSSGGCSCTGYYTYSCGKTGEDIMMIMEMKLV